MRLKMENSNIRALKILAFICSIIAWFFLLNALFLSFSYDWEDMLSALLLGLFFLMLSSTCSYQIKRIIKARKQEVIVTLLECEKCGFKKKRRFKRGDYIFKKTDEACSRCKADMLIVGIYREPLLEKDLNILLSQENLGGK
ncbi:MAG TPA: hypothetical protein ENG66_06690 [Thermococcus sp.]|nr:hypothetical protein [Thermococcus sp.]